jgi:hypothetical protein
MARPVRLERLHHLTAAENWPFIQRDGLLSTATLLARSGADAELRARVRAHRPDAIRLPDGVLVGDQWCQPPAALGRCLTGGLTPQDWYDRLNGYVFLWPDAQRAERHARTYAGRAQVLLSFDAEALLGAHADRVVLTRFNVGYALRRAKPRGLDAFKPYHVWRERPWKPVEVLIEEAVPDAMAHLVDVRELRGDESLRISEALV